MRSASTCRASFDKVLDLKACYLQSEWSVRLVNRMRELAKAHGWAPWHIRDHTGILRHLVIRQPANEPGRMVNLVTNGAHEDVIAAVTEMLQAEFPEVSTFINTINTGVAQTAFGERQDVVFGPGVIYDQIGGLRFEIAPNAFFQTNTYQAEKLYAVAAEMADLRPDDLVYDLYCGAGTISLYLAQRLTGTGRVVGAELVEEAVENAKRNAEANGIENATFVSGDMRDLFGEAFVAEHGTPDVVIVDPPRAGLHPESGRADRAPAAEEARLRQLQPADAGPRPRAARAEDAGRLLARRPPARRPLSPDAPRGGRGEAHAEGEVS